ncbi:hypothetical protein BU17DRAFT_63277 [Hysterangium stoloniferum]|nr:hypothetical protein BU17DRAFT_63277 [Hysterangium stoloniferum]
MRFLPGGNHMVTVSRTTETSGDVVVIWDMTFRGRRNHVAIAMLQAQTTVQKLQARYAVVRGHISLVIGFIRPPVEGTTTVTTVYVPVGVLNEISTLGPGTRACHEFMEKIQDPFERLSEPKTRYPVGAMSLTDIDGHPLLAVVHRPRRVAFYHLTSEGRSTLKLGPVPGYDTWRHSIWDIKILTIQRQILVIRVLIGNTAITETIPVVFELYDIPRNGADIENPMARERRIISNYGIDGFYVSDGDASWNFKIDPELHVPMLHNLADCPPPPISIFVSTTVPRGFVHFLMRPETTHDSSAYSYALPRGTHSQYIWDEPETATIIPGAYRSIVWMRSFGRQPTQGISVLQMAVYSTDGYKFSRTSDTGHTTLHSGEVASGEAMDVDEDGPINIRSPTQRALKYPVIPPELAQTMRNGIWGIQFDEWLGRMFVATVDTRDKIDVLDWSL